MSTFEEIESDMDEMCEACPTCGSLEKEIRKLVADETCHKYGGPTLWDPCTDSWHAGGRIGD